MGPGLTIIHKAYDLIKNSARWTQGYYQKNQLGFHCPWAEGYSFCALGALGFVCEGDCESRDKAQCLLQRFSEKVFNQAIQDRTGQDRTGQDVNDARPAVEAHKNVLHVYESIIEEFRDRDPTEEDLVTVRL